MDNHILDAHQELAQQAYDALEAFVWGSYYFGAAIFGAWLIWRFVCLVCDLTVR